MQEHAELGPDYGTSKVACRVPSRSFSSALAKTFGARSVILVLIDMHPNKFHLGPINITP